MSGRGKFGRYLKRRTWFPGYVRAISSDDAQQIIDDLLRVLAAAGLLTEAEHPYRRGAHGYRVRAATLVWRPGDGARGADDPLARTFSGAESPGSTRTSSACTATSPATLAGLVAREHTAQVDPRSAQQREDEFRDGRAEAAVLLADDGARRGHRRPQRRGHAQRPADPRELRAALRPGGPVRPAGAGHHLLRHRQQPRPVLLPPLRADGRRRRHPAAPRPAQRGPAPLPRPRDLARRDRRPAGPGDPRVHRHGRHRAGRQAAARPAPALRPGWRETTRTTEAARRAMHALTAVLQELATTWRPGPRGGTRGGSST